MGRVCTWAKLTADRVSYYAKSVADGKESYYSGQGESPGIWLGEGARMLGLAGELRDGELTRIASGQHPLTGETLRNGNGMPTGQQRCEALDFTFNPTKTVSLLYASGEQDLPEQLPDAHERAVRTVVRTLEAEMTIVRKGKTGSPQERQYHAAGVLAAAYRHRTSRSGDPQLHTHVSCQHGARATQALDRAADQEPAELRDRARRHLRRRTASQLRRARRHMAAAQPQGPS